MSAPGLPEQLFRAGAREPGAAGLYLRVGKPFLDRVLGLALVIVTAPLTALVALAVRVKLGPGVLYVQNRVGRGGATFRMYKFRTMGADRRRQETPFPYEDRRVRHKTTEDPRHTGFGRFLRRRSLDELPQLWNVVRGDMSLVGPRPELPQIVAAYEPWQHRRHNVKPGLTGLWQVSARNLGDSSLMHEHTDIDLRYVDEVSLGTDLAILRRTPSVLLPANGVGGH